MQEIPAVGRLQLFDLLHIGAEWSLLHCPSHAKAPHASCFLVFDFFFSFLFFVAGVLFFDPFAEMFALFRTFFSSSWLSCVNSWKARRWNPLNATFLCVLFDFLPLYNTCIPSPVGLTTSVSMPSATNSSVLSEMWSFAVLVLFWNFSVQSASNLLLSCALSFIPTWRCARRRPFSSLHASLWDTPAAIARWYLASCQSWFNIVSLVSNARGAFLVCWSCSRV